MPVSTAWEGGGRARTRDPSLESACIENRVAPGRGHHDLTLAVAGRGVREHLTQITVAVRI